MARSPAIATHEPERVQLDTLKPHPRNYRTHPVEQLDHIRHSIREHGFYRNVVVARDGTILAGHGVVEAAKREKMSELPVVRLDIEPDSIQALKVLTADNELARFAGIDDRQLTDLLKTIGEVDIAELLGTGYDAAQLANLVMVTRSTSEVADFDAAAEWVGMPEYEPTAKSAYRVIVHLVSEADLVALFELLDVQLVEQRQGTSVSIQWPARENVRRDSMSVRFTSDDDEAVA